MDKKKRNFTVFILSLMVFLSNGDNYASATLISNIARDLGLSISVASISVTAYMLGFGLFTLFFGPLGDKYGKVRIVNIAAAGTAIFSILGAVAFNLSSLVVFRLINGMFGSGIFPVTLALVGGMFNDKERHKAIAGVMSMGFLGSATATIIGGTVSYFASWRFVYLIYGIGELILAIIMLKTLERDKSTRKKLEFTKSYKVIFSDFKFIRLAGLLILMGFSYLGTFTYTGVSIMGKTGLSIFAVGFILAFYGVGTVFGAKIAPKLKLKMGKGFLISAGLIGFAALTLLSYTSNIYLIILAMFGFGFSFISIQSTIVSTLQAMFMNLRGTVMSIVAFNLFLGASIGTSLNARILEISNMGQIYLTASIIIVIIGLLSSLFIYHFEQKKKNKAFTAVEVNS
jgi:predicted MFS family arabinose efflux permease